MSLNNESEFAMSSPNYICTVSDAFPQGTEDFLEDKKLCEELYPEEDEDEIEPYKENFIIRIISLLTGKA